MHPRPAQVDDTEVINFLLSTEIIPLCLRTMEMGSELSKTVATFIVQKILLDDVGLNYICATAERFFAVGAVLGNMVRQGLGHFCAPRHRQVIGIRAIMGVLSTRVFNPRLRAVFYLFTCR